MNVLFLLHLPPPVHGSSMVGKYIFDSKHINDVFSCRYINVLSSKTIAETGRPSLSKAIGFMAIWLKMVFELLLKKPDVCYFAITVSGFAFFRDVALVFLLKIFRVKRVFHLHNKGVSFWQKKWVYRICYKYIFNKAEVILLSKHLYSDVQNFVPESSLHICPNGIPFDDRTSKLKRKDRGEKAPKILFFSNLIESKGVFILLEACAKLKQKGISFSCDFIGGEGDISREQFQEKVKYFDLEQDVDYLGRKYEEEKERAFVEADIFAFPTFYFYETFGLVNLEAMKYRLPIISTYEGGIPDVVVNNKTGFLVRKEDSTELADKLEILIKNPKLRIEMGEAGYNKYKENFTLDIFEKRLIEMIQTASPTTQLEY